MPTSKLIYATSDSDSNYKTGNTTSDFVVNIPEGLVLASAGHVLTVCFKGIFIPGPVTTKEGISPGYIKIHLDLIEFQRTGSNWSQCLSRLLLLQNNSHFIETPHNIPISVTGNRISNFRVKITDDKNQEVNIRSVDNSPTILKLEISTMDLKTKGYTVTCSSDDLHPQQNQERYEGNSLKEFRTWLPSEIDVESQLYEVGLTAAIIPKDVYACKTDFSISLEKYVEKTKSLYDLVINIPAVKKINSIPMLLYILNKIINLHEIPIELAVVNKCITLRKSSTKRIKSVLRSVKTKYNWKKYATSSFNLKKKCECEQNDVLDQDNDLCSCKTWSKIDISTGLAFLFSSQHQTMSFRMNMVMSTNEIPIRKKDGYQVRMSALVPTGLKIYTPIVVPTIVGRQQENLVEIIPFLQNVHNEKNTSHDSSFIMYYPNEVTYHNVQRGHVKEILFQIKNMEKGGILYNKSGLPVTIVLHFRPVH